ncbi:hypothetical protein NLS1_32060 [Nocardioides sp. LS1]|nr:hypothetical protein NLS1_32060 [Nocardioides sp. LS1]
MPHGPPDHGRPIYVLRSIRAAFQEALKGEKKGQYAGDSGNWRVSTGSNDEERKGGGVEGAWDAGWSEEGHGSRRQ